MPVSSVAGEGGDVVHISCEFVIFAEYFGHGRKGRDLHLHSIRHQSEIHAKKIIDPWIDL